MANLPVIVYGSHIVAIIYMYEYFPQWAMLEIHDKSFISKIFEHPMWYDSTFFCWNH